MALFTKKEAARFERVYNTSLERGDDYRYACCFCSKEGCSLEMCPYEIAQGEDMALSYESVPDSLFGLMVQIEEFPWNPGILRDLPDFNKVRNHGSFFEFVQESYPHVKVYIQTSDDWGPGSGAFSYYFTDDQGQCWDTFTEVRERMVMLEGFDENWELEDAEDLTPLMLYSLSGNVEVVRRLLEQSDRLTAKDNRGKTALHWAAEGGVPEVIGMLVDKGIKVDEPDGDHRTALMLAAFYGNTRAAQKLIGLGADLGARDTDGQTALDSAKSMNDNEQIEEILRVRN